MKASEFSQLRLVGGTSLALQIVTENRLILICLEKLNWTMFNLQESLIELET